MLTQRLQDGFDMAKVNHGIRVRREDSHVIAIHNTITSFDMLGEHMLHEALERTGYIGQTERRRDKLK